MAKTMYAVKANQDRDEGRGSMYVVCLSETEELANGIVTSNEFGQAYGTMGYPGKVEHVEELLVFESMEEFVEETRAAKRAKESSQVWAAAELGLEKALREQDLANANLSTIDSAANACVMRVLSRLGLGPFEYKFVWPVMTVNVHSSQHGSRKFTFDVREMQK